MNEDNFNHLYKFLVLAFVAWLIPFLVGLFFGSASSNIVDNNAQLVSTAINNIFYAYSHNNKWDAFVLIFFNNIKVVLYNIAGGVFIGLATFLNLALNGYVTASTFASIHQNGMPWVGIIKHTLPHSVELIGIWLSGATGFSLAQKIINVMRGRQLPSLKYYKHIGICSLISFLIILIAAYIEAYISV